MLTIPEAAERLRVSQATIRRLCAKGALRCINVGTKRQRVYRIFEDTLHDINMPEPPRLPEVVVGKGRLDKMLEKLS
jgi:excisionase family DNA binding protein